MKCKTLWWSFYFFVIPGANRVFTEFACKSQRLQVCINKHTARFNSLTIIVTFFLFPFTILKRQLLGHWSVLLLISKYNWNYYLKASKAISQLKIRRESTPDKRQTTLKVYWYVALTLSLSVLSSNAILSSVEESGIPL